MVGWRLISSAYDSGQTKLRPWMPQSSMLETAKSWYTGANAEGIENGWDTQFYKNAFTSTTSTSSRRRMPARAVSSTTGWIQDVNSEATGVATWGAAADDEEARSRAPCGSATSSTTVVRSPASDDDYDKATADVMVREFLFSNDEKRNAWKTPTLGPDGRPQMDQAKYAGMVEEKRRERHRPGAALQSPRRPTTTTMRAREVALRDGKGDGGGRRGCCRWRDHPVVRSVSRWARYCPVPATSPGRRSAPASVPWWVVSVRTSTRTSWSEMAARSQAKAELANKDFGETWRTRGLMELREYSQLGLRFLNPISTWCRVPTTRCPSRAPTSGDMTSEFYAVNPDGTRKAGVVIRVPTSRPPCWTGSPRSPHRSVAGPISRRRPASSPAGSPRLKTGSIFNERTGEYDKLDGWQDVGPCCRVGRYPTRCSWVLSAEWPVPPVAPGPCSPVRSCGQAR